MNGPTPKNPNKNRKPVRDLPWHGEALENGVKKKVLPDGKVEYSGQGIIKMPDGSTWIATGVGAHITFEEQK